VTGPEGPGWVIEIKGHHFYNSDITTWGGTHVRDTFLKELREQTVELPSGPGLPPTRFTMKELGIDFPVLAVDPPIERNFQIRNPFYEGPPAGTGGYPGAAEGMPGMMPGVMPGMGMAPAGVGAPGAGLTGGAAKPDSKKEKEEPKEPPFFVAPKYTFVLQFCWQEKLLTERLRQRAEAQLQQQQEQQQQEPEQPEQPPPATPGNKMAAANTGG
jgi:type IV pilus assembly protein PilM